MFMVYSSEFDFFMQTFIYMFFFLPFSLLLPLSYTQKIAPYIHFAVTSFFTEILECKNGERILILFLFLVFFFTAVYLFHCDII